MQIKKYFRNSAEDHGVALLFALGILSALMLLGIAFMGSSLFSRRVAENRSNGNEARLLARSVANQVAAAVMNFQNEIDKKGEMPHPDYRGVFSVSSTSDHPNHDKYGEFLRGYERGSRKDYSKLDVDARMPYHGKESSAQWVYVHVVDKVKDEAGKKQDVKKIIGRYAYQVLPSVGFGCLNYYHLMSRKFDKQEKYPGEKTPGKYDNCPDAYRFGWGINELVFGNGFIADADAKYTTKTEIPAYFPDTYAAQKQTAGDSADFIERVWMESTFTEGKTPTFREVTADGYARFNLLAWNGKSWYARFGTAAANSAAVVNKIMTATDFSDARNRTDDKVVQEDGSVGGIGFFCCIGQEKDTESGTVDEKGSFDSIADFRRQIVANFNDYCDGDDIPTSDVDAANWDQERIPSYTGNEKTLYINEIVLGGLIKLAPGTDKITLDTADLVLGAELIDVYGNEKLSGNISSADYTLTGKILQGTASDGGSAASQNYFSLQITPQFSIDYKYKVQENGIEQEKTGTLSEWNPEHVSEVFRASEGQTDTRTVKLEENREYTVSFSNTAAPYKVGAARVTGKTSDSVEWLLQPESTLKDNEDAKKKCVQNIKDANYVEKSIAITQVTLKKIKIALSDFNAVIGNLVLGVSEKNVDYVKTEKIGVPDKAESKYIDVTGSPLTSVFLVGGMEAKDPRQNLNVKSSATDWLMSDWIWSPALHVVDGSEAIPGASLTGTVADTCADADALAGAIKELGGLVNTQADPSSTTYSTDRDKETVSDPGWTTTAMISTAVIRNAPMVSPWELGFIHRGIPFQTINLKKSGTASGSYDINAKTGTTYSTGDGGILDWIRMTEANYSYGKINLQQFFPQQTTDGLNAYKNVIRYETSRDLFIIEKLNQNGVIQAPSSFLAGRDSNEAYYSSYDKTRADKVGGFYNDWKEMNDSLLYALFNQVPINEKAAEFISKTQDGSYTATSSQHLSTTASAGGGSSDLKKLVDTLSDTLFEASNAEESAWSEDRTKIIEKIYDAIKNKVDENDAAQEAVIGRTINLLTTSLEPPTIFRAVIVAQAIRDVGGTGSSVTVVSSDHPTETGSATLDEFDTDGTAHANPKDNVHYDVITGEAKILVTYERNPVTGQVIIRDIENIE